MTYKSYFKKPKPENDGKKKCKVCSKMFIPKRSFQGVCDYRCANRLVKIKAKKEKQEKRDEFVNYSKLMSEAKQAFQKWVRLRDENKPCVSCGKLTAEQWDGGHYFKAEVYKGVIFNVHNVHKQCSNCNRWLDGNLIPYRKELIARIGLQRVEELEELADTTRQKKWSRAELISIRDFYKKK
jgi:hypothetical protein